MKDKKKLQEEENNLREQNIQREKELAEYKNKLHELKDEDLEKEEQEWIKKLEELDSYIKDRKYDLPSAVKYEGESYSRIKIGGFISSFLKNKLEIEWKYVTGIMDLCKFWSAATTTVTYAYLDSTLRLLDQFKYKGADEWDRIIIVNEYFKQCNGEYHEDVNKLIQLSKMHNAVLDEQQLRAKVEPTEASKEDK